MSPWLIFGICLLYLGVLFAIATFAERRKQQGRSIIQHPWVYTLSLAVYCTAWTFYGSVGRAASSGIEFVTIYIGPTLMAGLFWPVLRKMLLISRTYRLTSLADFISTRYGKNFSIAVLVTVCSVVGLLPYIALQLKSIADSFFILSEHTMPVEQGGSWLSIGIVGVLITFTMLYGARSVDAAEKHEGLIAAVAFESLVKLVAFLAVGLFVTYGLFNGFGDIFEKIAVLPQGKALQQLSEASGPSGWTAMIVLSMLAILLLPRQWQVGVVENTHPTHTYTAMWGLPLYLFLINLFVLPVAYGGMLLMGQAAIDPDYYVLALPLMHGKSLLAVCTWLGGFAAATGMIIVETIALSTMLSNNVVMPLLLKSLQWRSSVDESFVKIVLWVRRLSIVLVLLLAWLYSQAAVAGQSLVSIGLISFCAVAQFAPALLGGLFWKQGNHTGAIAGLAAGFAIWAYTLVVPNLFPAAAWVQSGPGGIDWLRPHALFFSSHLSPITLATWWSLFINVVLYAVVSLYTRPSAREVYQAELFVDVYRLQDAATQGTGYTGQVSMAEVQALMAQFVGQERSASLLSGYAHRHQIPPGQLRADGRMVAFAERVLGGVIGTASAHIMVSSLTKQEEINLEEVLSILRENQQMIEMNKELRRKSQELSKATRQLQEANRQLKEMDEQKDEFLYTVTHELRTPLTSIRALSEIVHDNPDLEDTDKQHYLSAIIQETERLSHLINQVLTLERYESGRHRPHMAPVHIGQIITAVADNMRPVAQEKGVELQVHINDTQALVQADKDLLTQVMYNLLGNAVKFARHQIKISLIDSYNEWQIRVQDDGKGIEPGLEQLIFDKFFQARNQTLTKPEGSGLGLAICKKIMQMHGGSIAVESTAGKGATFVATLPA